MYSMTIGIHPWFILRIVSSQHGLSCHTMKQTGQGQTYNGAGRFMKVFQVSLSLSFSIVSI